MEKLINIDQLSELIQVSKNTIYHWVHADYVPHYKFPKGLRFRMSEINNWIMNKKRKGRSNYKAVIQ